MVSERGAISGGGARRKQKGQTRQKASSVLGRNGRPSSNVVLSLYEEHGSRGRAAIGLSEEGEGVVRDFRARSPSGSVAVGHTSSVCGSIERDGQNGEDAGAREGIFQRLSDLMRRSLRDSITDDSWRSCTCSIRTSQHYHASGLQELCGNMRARQRSLDVHLDHLFDGSHELVRVRLKTASCPSSSRAEHCVVHSI